MTGLEGLKESLGILSPSLEATRMWGKISPTFFLEFGDYLDTIDRLGAAVRAARRRPNRGSNPSRYARRRRRGR